MTKNQSRRAFAQRIGATVGGSALAMGAPALRQPAHAAQTVKTGFISPRSGPLAGFGEVDPYVLGLGP